MRARALLSAFLLAVFLSSSPARAVIGNATGGGTYHLDENARNLKFAGIPIPGYSDVLGLNLGVVAMVYYKTDRNDDYLPPSFTGVFGFYSQNNSWVGSVFQRFHLDRDNWRLTGAFGTGSIKYQFNPAAVGPGFPDVFIDYTTATGFLFLEGSRRIWRTLYLGLILTSWSAQVTLEPDLLETESERFNGPGVTGEWDNREHVMNPRKGYHVQARYLVYRDAFGSDRDFEMLRWSAAAYTTLGDTTRVLAARVLQSAAFGDVPFSAQSVVNGNQNLRGYSNGRYRGNQLVSVEAEYRWNFYRRWGAVIFAGVGWCADAMAKMSMKDTLPSGGLGARFLLIKDYRINARIDYGWGKGDQALYFSIGEAF